MSKSRHSIDDSFLDSSDESDYEFRENLQDKKEKLRRQTELRRRMEDRIERRRLSEELGMYLNEDMLASSTFYASASR